MQERTMKKPVLDLQHNVQLRVAISHNAAFTSFYDTIQGQPGRNCKLDCLTDPVTGLQSLSLNVGDLSELCSDLPVH
jgi:hypothetical protein